MAAGRIIIPNCMPALDINGNPVSGAKLTFYVNETTTLLPVYTTSALSVAHPNPISADAAGAFASIFADTAVAYSVAVTDADNAPIAGLRNRDNVMASLFYGDDYIDTAALKANNLSDLADAAEARENLGSTTVGDAVFIAANAAAARSAIGAVIGTDVQAYDADLTTWAGVTPGTGVGAALAVAVGSAGAPVVLNGAGGTPSSMTLTNATGLPVAGITDSTTEALGVGSLELGHASDTTLARSSAGNMTIEGNLVYRAGGIDVPVADGGTGASTADDARANLVAVGTVELASSTGGALVGNQLTAGANLRTQTLTEFIEGGLLMQSQFDGTDAERLTRAITEAAATRDGGAGQTVLLPRGEFEVSATFNLDNRAAVEGVSKRGTIIKAAAGHAGTWMVTVDNGTSSMFDNRLEKLTLDCNSVAGMGAVDSDAWQEGGGLRDVLILGFRTYGVRFENMDGGAAVCRISDTEIFSSSSNCTAGIIVNDPSLTGSFLLDIEQTTLAGGGALATSMPRAIDVTAGSINVRSCHVENCTTGIYLDGNGNHTIIGLTGASSDGGVGSLVEIASTFTGSLTMIGCQRNGATNFLKDNRTAGYGTIAYDIPYLRIDPEPALFLGGAAACVTIDGTGTPSVSKGFGVSSITDNGTGDYTINLTRSAPSGANFACLASTNSGVGNVRCDLIGVNSVRVRTFDAAGTPADVNELHLLVVRVA